MKIKKTGNQVKFLLDGENFFRELTQQLDNLIKAKPSESTYVRMAFWEMDAACCIDRSLTAPRQVGAMLHAAADAGHTVQIICWKPRGLAGPLLSLGWTLPAPIPNYQSARTHVVGERKDVRGSVQVYREEHRGPFFGTSNHQKIVIFSIDGVLTVIVGGMNLTDKSYAPATHEEAPGLAGALQASGANLGGLPWYYNVANWHDTAVVITGPAAADVEEEWLRRWQKKRPSPRTKPAKAPVQAPVAEGSTVTILTTNSEVSPRERDIRAALCARISSAERYVYLENYVLSDPDLVAALVDRLRTNKDLVVLFVTGKGDHPYNILNRMTRLRLVLAAGGEGYVLLDQCGKKQSLEEHFKEREVSGKLTRLLNPWFEKDEFRYKTPEGKVKRVPLGKVYDAYSNRVAFAYPTNGYVAPSGRGLYVHSKLVLVDDDAAFIGSANLSYRSMDYDGEICVCVEGAAAKDIRVALFEHFNLDCEREYTDAKAIQRKILDGTFSSALVTLGRKRPRPGFTFLQLFHSGEWAAERPKISRGDHTWH